MGSCESHTRFFRGEEASEDGHRVEWHKKWRNTTWSFTFENTWMLIPLEVFLNSSHLLREEWSRPSAEQITKGDYWYCDPIFRMIEEWWQIKIEGVIGREMHSVVIIVLHGRNWNELLIRRAVRQWLFTNSRDPGSFILHLSLSLAGASTHRRGCILSRMSGKTLRALLGFINWHLVNKDPIKKACL